MTDQDIMRKFRKASDETLGAFGECVWMSVLNQAGFDYSQRSDTSAGAAMIHHKDGKLILPDLEASAGPFSFYIESKTKSGPVWYRHASEYRHGIDQRNYSHYLAFADERSVDCAIGIVELFTDSNERAEWSGALLFGCIRTLGSPIAGFSSQAHMCYWPRQRFSHVGTLTPTEACAVRSSVPARLAEGLLRVLPEQFRTPRQTRLPYGQPSLPLQNRLFPRPGELPF